MGLANRILVTVTTAPSTNNADLDAPVAGFTEFGDHFSVDTPVEYWITDAGNFEHGLGTWLQATNELQRDTVLETLIGGVFDNTSPAKLALSGACRVFLGAGAHVLGDTSLAAPSTTLSIPLVDRVYRFVLTKDLTLAAVNVPTAPQLGSAEIELVQDATGGWIVSFPAAWRWSNGLVVPAATAANAITRYTITMNAVGSIDIDGARRA